VKVADARQGVASGGEQRRHPDPHRRAHDDELISLALVANGA
jgi:hypothetical protein